MSAIPNVNSETYFNDLREFREQAMTASPLIGRRVAIGDLSMGKRWAVWETEESGLAVLADNGLRRGNERLLPLGARTHLFTSVTEGAGSLLTHYSMDLGQAKDIRAMPHAAARASIGTDLLRIMFARYAEMRGPLAQATLAERRNLYREMQRGASGQYRIR
jgi:hypothetical protein